MDEFKILTFKEISDALNTGKEIEVEGCGSNPFKLIEGFLVDRDENSHSVSYDIQHAMTGLQKARIIYPKFTRWLVVCKSGHTECHEYLIDACNAENHYKGKGKWLRTVKVEV